MDASIRLGNVSEIDIGNQLITDQEAHNGPFFMHEFFALPHDCDADQRHTFCLG